MKARLLALLLLAGTSVFGQIGIGITIGHPPPVRVERVRPRSPGAGYVWVGGYWYPVRGHYKWHSGYWTRPPYAGARWVEPRHDGARYFNGYWDGDRGRFEHDHKFDKDRNRDWRDRH